MKHSHSFLIYYVKHFNEYMLFGKTHRPKTWRSVFFYLFPIGSQFLDFIHWMVFDNFFFYCVTLKMIYTFPLTAENCKLQIQRKIQVLFVCHIYASRRPCFPAYPSPAFLLPTSRRPRVPCPSVLASHVPIPLLVTAKIVCFISGKYKQLNHKLNTSEACSYKIGCGFFNFFQIWRKKSSFWKISIYIWTGP